MPTYLGAYATCSSPRGAFTPKKRYRDKKKYQKLYELAMAELP